MSFFLFVHKPFLLIHSAFLTQLASTEKDIKNREQTPTEFAGLLSVKSLLVSIPETGKIEIANRILRFCDITLVGVAYSSTADI